MKIALATVLLFTASVLLLPGVQAGPPKLEVVAEWTRLSYDLGDSAAEKAYQDQQVWKKVLMQGVKVDSKGNLYVSTARWGGKEVPATLSKLVKKGKEGKLQPFPSKAMNDVSNPNGLKAVQVVATLPSNTDGMTADRENNLYMTALTLNGIMQRDARTGRVSTWVASDEISWPDTLAWGPGGTLYLASNHLHLWVDGDMDFDNPKVPNFRIYRAKVNGKPYRAK